MDTEGPSPGKGHDPASYGDTFADVYDDWFGGRTDLDAAVDVLVELAGGAGGAGGVAAGRVLELGAGTGRLAIPLAERGLEVWGLDASEQMLARLRAKPGGERVRTVLADMATIDLTAAAGGRDDSMDGAFALVFVVYNTLFNLDSADAQHRCLERVRAVLAPTGRFVVEAFVPTDAPDEPTNAIEARTVERERVILTVTRREPADQTITGHHVELTEAGGVRLRPWRIRYLWPAQLDALAAEVGLGLVDRWAGWDRMPFDDDTSAVHVSVYEKR